MIRKSQCKTVVFLFCIIIALKTAVSQHVTKSSQTVANKIPDNADGKGSEPHCVWYDQCYQTPARQMENCVYSKPAPVLKDQRALEILEELCPSLYKNSG